jgi:phospholipid/cholesterol/gamma-HCH transport system substrate-binding protein
MPSPSQVNWAKIRVTVVVIAGLSILSVLVYLLTGGTLLTEKVTVYIYVPDASGLDSNTPVRVNGIDVGKVRAVALSGSNEPNRVIQVAMRVERDHLRDIPVDSYAQISSDSLIGDKFVDITRGKSGQYIRPESEITYRGQPELLKTLDLEQFAQRMRGIEAMLSDIEQGKNRMGQLIQSEDMYNDLDRWLRDVERAIQTVAVDTGTLGQVLYTDQLYRKFSDPLAQIDNDLARIQAGQGPFGGLLRDDAQYLQMQGQLASLRQSIAGIRSNPFVQSDEMYTGWNRTVASMIQQVDEIGANPLFRSTEMYDNLNGFAKEMENTVRDFRRDPQKFLRIKVF